MLFNSLAFLIFFPLVVFLYWVLPVKLRNVMLLVASYYFYMNWEPVYAILILFSSVTTWWFAKLIDKYPGRKKTMLWLCLGVNLLILFTYKYAAFVGDNLQELMRISGLAIEIPKFTLLLPVGISFYTFQAIGYTIDVYRRTIEPEKNLATYCLFVSFFPQLVAGPIERAKNLLPQFHVKHVFSGVNLITGLEMMVWGYFMKLCIADNVSTYVDAVYNNMPMHNGTSILLATFFFTFQIFCDFGGYSLIAIGASKCMGFSLMQNFRQPYLATTVKDFWRRWHISLSSWFSDYVYIPLGGSRCSELKHQRNLLVTFIVSGLWHGANWTFVFWGAYHGLLQVFHSIKRKIWPVDKTKRKKLYSRIMDVLAVIVVFLTAMFGWVLFRANTFSDAIMAYKKMFTQHGMLFNGEGKPAIMLPLIMIVILMIKEILMESGKVKMRFNEHNSVVRSVVLMSVLVCVILSCASFNGGQFIYFQF